MWNLGNKTEDHRGREGKQSGKKQSGLHIQWNTTQPTKNEILPFAMMWMEPEGITLSEISQSEKDNYMISLISGI